jgi:ferrous iron transport protein A
MITILICQVATVTLSDLPLHQAATVQAVNDSHPNDTIARRLRELGFVPGEQVQLVARGPVGGEPVLVQVGYTRFALRLAEAARVQVAA